MGCRFTNGTTRLVYIECRAESAEAARSGAMQILQHLNASWFNDATLKMEEKFKFT